MTRPLILVCVAAATFLAACDVEPREPSPTEPQVATTTTVPATTTTTLSVGEAVATFEACMSDRGVVISEIPLDAEGRPRLELALGDVDFTDSDAVAALSECAELLAEGALDLSIWPRLQEGVQTALEEFSQCVRSRGVANFPDPVRLFGGVGGPYPLDEIPFGDPDLDSAVDTCRSRLAEFEE